MYSKVCSLQRLSDLLQLILRLMWSSLSVVIHKPAWSLPVSVSFPCSHDWRGSIRTSMSCFKKKKIIKVELLYNVVLVSAAQQSESAICTHMSTLFWISFPFRSPPNAEESSRCCPVCSYSSCILYTAMYICQSHSSISSSVVPFSSCPQSLPASESLLTV